jgi:hypothetical protein
MQRLMQHSLDHLGFSTTQGRILRACTYLPAKVQKQREQDVDGDTVQLSLQLEVWAEITPHILSCYLFRTVMWTAAARTTCIAFETVVRFTWQSVNNDWRLKFESIINTKVLVYKHIHSRLGNAAAMGVIVS